MKLDYKKTTKVGFAFAIIILFWNVYDFVVPLLLENAFGLSNFWRGAVMGLDNLLSLFLLPIFGKLSDQTNTRYGKRTPYIFFGTIVSVVLMIFIPVTAQKQLNEAETLRQDISYQIEVDDAMRSQLLAEWYDDADAGNYEYISRMDLRIMKDNGITREAYINLKKTVLKVDNGIYYKGIRKVGSVGVEGADAYDYVEISSSEYQTYETNNANYNKYVVNGVNTYLSEQVHSQITKQHVSRLVIYLVVLLFVLVSMATFRSPAVALMPDVTPKPLRSQANAIINLAGGVGGAIGFIIYTVAFMVDDNPFFGIYLVTAICMLLLLTVFLLLVKEPKMCEECKKICEEYGITDEEMAEQELKEIEKEDGVNTDESNSEIINAERKKLEKAKFRSFILILASIFMWFMGYNAVSSNLSVYCVKVLNLSAGVASLISGASMAISAIAFIPVGYLAVKIGRKKSIIIGFALAVISFVLIWLFVRPIGMVAAIMFGAFYLIAGFGLIIANVNTFPMVVELSTDDNVGKYTGYYYMATMSAQAITPAIAGLFMDYVGNYALFGYSAVCVVVAIVLMQMVKHGDSKAVLPKSKLEMMAGDD